MNSFPFTLLDGGSLILLDGMLDGEKIILGSRVAAYRHKTIAEREVTVLFAAIRDYTTLPETHDARGKLQLCERLQRAAGPHHPGGKPHLA